MTTFHSTPGTVRLARISAELDLYAKRVIDPSTRPSAVEIAAGLQAASQGIAWALEQVDDRAAQEIPKGTRMANWLNKLSWIVRVRGWWTKVREYGR